MGDRCSVELLCRKEDAAWFEEIGFVKVDWGEQCGHVHQIGE